MTNHPARVLYVTHASNLLGASRSLLDLISNLDRQVIEPVVLLKERGPLEGRLDEIGIPYVRMPYAQAVWGTQSNYPTWAKKALNSIATRRIARLLHEQRIDIVHNNSLLVDVGMRAARLAELPYVCHVRELVEEGHGLVLFNEVLTKDLMSHAAMNVFISQYVADKFVSWIGDAPSSILYDAVDLDGFRGRMAAPLSVRERLKVFMPGRFQPMKGQLDAIKATEKVHSAGVPVQLVLRGSIGYPEYYEQCCSYVVDHGMDYIDIGSFSDDVAAEYADADISLMCSGAEAMGRVTIEAMIAGCLVIGANAGATPELIKDRENGLLYEYGNVQSLADCMLWAFEHKGEAVALARRAQDDVRETFSGSSYADKMTALYEDALRANGLGGDGRA